jgi:hypothetical protein
LGRGYPVCGPAFWSGAPARSAAFCDCHRACQLRNEFLNTATGWGRRWRPQPCWPFAWVTRALALFHRTDAAL